MADRFDIREGMEVVGSDGVRLGRVGDVESGRIRLVGGPVEHIDTGRVERVADGRVHLSDSAAVVRGGFAARVAEATGDPDPGDPHSPPRKGALYWVLGILALLIALLLVYTCTERQQQEKLAEPAQIEAGPVNPTAIGGTQAVALPNGRQLQLAPDSLALQLRNYLAGSDIAPRTFQFERVHFDTASAEVRPAEVAAIASVGQVLQAYPDARVRVVGFADARGAAPANADLGQNRADAVAALLAGNGVPRDRIETASGGEGAPAATNATAGGQAENRRTELIVTAR